MSGDLRAAHREMFRRQAPRPLLGRVVSAFLRYGGEPIQLGARRRSRFLARNPDATGDWLCSGRPYIDG